MGRQGCNCKYAKEAKILYGRGISIPDNLCGKRCGGGGCDYWNQLKQPGHKFLPHQMLFFFDGKNTPLVVFDELDVKVFLQTYSVDANELVLLARVEHKDLWDAFYKLMTENQEFSGIELYNGLVNKLNLEDLLALRNHLTTIKFTDAEINDLTKAYNLPMFGIGEILLKVMDSELDSIIKGSSQFNPRLHINPVKNDNKQVKLEIILRNEPPIWLKDKPIILLGAKGDQTLFENLAYNRFYDIFSEVMDDSFWEKDSIYRFSKVKDGFGVYSELLNYEPLRWVIEDLKVYRPPLKGEIAGELFCFHLQSMARKGFNPMSVIGYDVG